MAKKIRNIFCCLVGLLILISMLSGCASVTSGKTATDSSSGPAAAISSSAGPSTAVTDSTQQADLLVAAAASLTDVTADIAEAYKVIKPNVNIKFTYGSSGALQTQIEEGAPVDIFMSAAAKQMDALEAMGLLLDGSRKELLVNKVVLVTPKDSDKGITGFQDLAEEKVSKIALGEPGSVPVGQYSEEIFTTLGIWDKVKAKANFGSDVRQVLTWVEGGEVDCGVVYATDAATSDKVKVVCEAPEGSHKPVIYPVAVIKSSIYPNEAGEFVRYLSSPEAAGIFKKYGFEMK
jgi:molybdate transport system substrate-binding protein